MTTSANIFFDFSELQKMGMETIVGKTVRIRKPERVQLGHHTIIDDFTYVSCGLTVGNYTHLGANGVYIGGEAYITIGDFVNIAPGCRIIAASNDFSSGGLVGPAIPEEFANKSIIANIEIADHVLLATNTVILPGINIPEGVSTGAFTLITPKTELKPWTLYAGIPARPIKKRESQRILDTASRLLNTL